MPDLTPTRLRVDVTATSREALYRQLEARAKAFFGDEEFRLDGDVEVDLETIDTWSGGTVHEQWSARAYFVNYRERE